MFPAALFFGAPYSESLFLLLAVGAFYAARTDRWAWAGACAVGAAATRSAGLLLLVPLLMLWWGSRERGRATAAWLLLAPLGAGAPTRPGSGLAEGDALRFLDVQDAWSRELAVPLSGAWDGFTRGARRRAPARLGPAEPVYFEIAAGDPYRIAAINIMLFATLVFALAACVGVLRRLPAAYGAWVAVSLVLPLSFPVTPQPLMSLPRFVACCFRSSCGSRSGARSGAPPTGWRPCPRSASGLFTRAVRELALDLLSRAVLLDALGTLVELQPPAPRLRRLLAAAGFEVCRGARGRRLRAPRSRYYLEHHLEGADRDSLDDLRDRCADGHAGGARPAGPRPRHGAPGDARRARVRGLPGRFAGARGAALGRTAARGGRATGTARCPSGWPAAGCSTSSTAWSPRPSAARAKPDPAIFRRALELAGAEPAEAVHVGDSLDNDVEGARAAGIRAVLIAREGRPPAGVESIATPRELPALL